jgi:hypothetical protein
MLIPCKRQAMALCCLCLKSGLPGSFGNFAQYPTPLQMNIHTRMDGWVLDHGGVWPLVAWLAFTAR